MAISPAPGTPPPEVLDRDDIETDVVETEVKPTEETSSASPWDEVLKRAQEVIERTSRAGGAYRRLTAVREAKAWFDENITLEDVRTYPADALLKWCKHKGVPEKGKLTINQAVAKSAAQLLIEEEDNMRNNRPLPERVTAPPKEPEARGPEDDEEDEADEGDEEEEFEAEEDVKPSQRRRAPPAPVPQAPQVVYAMPPPGYPMPGFPAPKNKGGRPITNPNNPNYRGPLMPQQPPPSRIIPQNLRDKIRVYHRGVGGKREPVMDYTLAELGGTSLEKFIHEYVDPDFGDVTLPENVYDIYEVGPNGEDRGSPATITVRNREVQTANPNDPIAQTRNVLELLQDVREMEESRHGQSQAMLDEFKKKAVHGGDMNSMMMLMMMERLMGGGGGSNPEAIVLKVMEKLNANGTPPPMPIVPMAPPVAPGPSSLDKVVEALLAKSLTPTPQPSMMDKLAELKLMREMFAPPPQPAIAPELVSILKTMADRLDRPRGGVEEALGNFDKITTMVKTLAPQVNMGGVAGALQSIITPELGRALGNVVAQGVSKAQEVAAKQQQARAMPANTQPVQPVQATATPVDEVPVAIQDAVRKFAAEKDEVKAREALMQMMLKMYDDPQLKVRLDAVLQEMLNGNFAPAKQALKDIIMSAQRPDLANEVFIDRALATIIQNAGGIPPEALWHKAPVQPIRPDGIDPSSIPTAAESEAKEKAEREVEEKARASANGVEAVTPPVEVTQFEKKPPAIPPPSNLA